MTHTGVHTETLNKAQDYLATKDLRGQANAQKYDMSAHNRASFNGSSEAASIVLSALSHYKQQSTKPCTTFDPNDMSVIWGGYRAGVEGLTGDGYSQFGFGSNYANGLIQSNQYSVGKNGYMSRPIFEYLEQQRDRFKMPISEITDTQRQIYFQSVLKPELIREDYIRWKTSQ